MKRLLKIITSNIELTEEEKEAIRFWFAVGGRDFSGEENATLDNLLQRMPRFSGGPLYRGIFADRKRFSPGKIDFWPNKASWTTNIDIAMTFTEDAEDPSPDAVPIIFVVKNASKYFYDIGQFMNNEENEVLSISGAKFLIEELSREDVNDTLWMIELIES